MVSVGRKNCFLTGKHLWQPSAVASWVERGKKIVELFLVSNCCIVMVSLEQANIDQKIWINNGPEFMKGVNKSFCEQINGTISIHGKLESVNLKLKT